MQPHRIWRGKPFQPDAPAVTKSCPDVEEDSYERLAEMDIQFAGEAPGPEEQVLRHLESEQLHKALSLLSDADQYLIWQIYFEERTERDLSEELGCSQNAVNKRKQRILEKMRCFLEKL